ncbi:MAG TPA: hypothetical protein VJ499_00940 [Flavisolibacter sp.]|nr:hypothetical protein [Flavisolibacter sp.]
MKEIDKGTALPTLKREIQEHFGRPVATSRDCNLLSEELFLKTSYKVNPNTLRRFFGLVKAPYPPSSATLAILSKYCGFDSLEELLQHNGNGQSNGDSLHNSDALMRYFVGLFRHTPVEEPIDKTFLALVKQTIVFLQQHPGLASRFQKAIAKTANGQRYYFELYAHIDQLNAYYGEGLVYYLKEKKTSEAQIRGHALLLLRGWLTNDAAAVRRHMGKIGDEHLCDTAHPVICARYYASKLYHASMENQPTAPILAEALVQHNRIIPSDGYYHHFPTFEYVFSIALTLTQHFTEALYYLEQAETKYKWKHSYVDDGLYETMRLLKAIALARTDQKQKAREQFDALKPSKFYFLTKKTNTIFYLLLAGYLNKLNPRSEAQLEELVKETGFVKLLELRD